MLQNLHDATFVGLLGSSQCSHDAAWGVSQAGRHISSSGFGLHCVGRAPLHGRRTTKRGVGMVGGGLDTGPDCWHWQYACWQACQHDDCSERTCSHGRLQHHPPLCSWLPLRVARWTARASSSPSAESGWAVFGNVGSTAAEGPHCFCRIQNCCRDAAVSGSLCRMHSHSMSRPALWIHRRRSTVAGAGFVLVLLQGSRHRPRQPVLPSELHRWGRYHLHCSETSLQRNGTCAQDTYASRQGAALDTVGTALSASLLVKRPNGLLRRTC